jgi:hypothetical protein
MIRLRRGNLHFLFLVLAGVVLSACRAGGDGAHHTTSPRNDAVTENTSAGIDGYPARFRVVLVQRSEHGIEVGFTGGTEDGVAVGQRNYVYDGTELVARIEVTRVEETRSTAIVKQQRRKIRLDHGVMFPEWENQVGCDRPLATQIDRLSRQSPCGHGGRSDVSADE